MCDIHIDIMYEIMYDIKYDISYTMYILAICHVYTRYFCYEVLKENHALLNTGNAGFNIRLFSTMAWVYRIRIQTNSRNINFDSIQCISWYMLYTMYIQALSIYYIHGICIVYTWYIPCIIFLWVPDACNLKQRLDVLTTPRPGVHKGHSTKQKSCFEGGVRNGIYIRTCTNLKPERQRRSRTQ